MPDALIYADTFRSPELRHEVPLGVPDPILYAEKDGTKHIVTHLDGGRRGWPSSGSTSCI